MASPAAVLDLYRHQQRLYDATRRHFQLGRDTLIGGLVPPDGGAILEIGCGAARNLVTVAETYPDARLYGIDVAPAVLEAAGQSVAEAGLAPRVRLAQANAATFDPEELFGVNQLDRIYACYVLSTVPDWQAVLDHACTMLAPGGSLHVVDFGTCHGLPGITRTGLYAWMRRFEVTPREHLETVLAATAVRHGLQPFFVLLYRGYATYGVLTRR
ncbi:MAG: class I SAM-dependent methyltransferase [Hyphomicrobiaceae bacterium]